MLRCSQLRASKDTLVSGKFPRPSRDVDVLAMSVAAPFVRRQGCHHKTGSSMSQSFAHNTLAQISHPAKDCYCSMNLQVHNVLMLILTLLALKTSRTSLTC